MDNSGVSPVKTAESTEMPFAGDSHGHALDGGSDSPTGLGTLEGTCIVYDTPRTVDASSLRAAGCNQ